MEPPAAIPTIKSFICNNRYGSGWMDFVLNLRPRLPMGSQGTSATRMSPRVSTGTVNKIWSHNDDEIVSNRMSLALHYYYTMHIHSHAGMFLSSIPQMMGDALLPRTTQVVSTMHLQIIINFMDENLQKIRGVYQRNDIIYLLPFMRGKAAHNPWRRYVIQEGWFNGKMMGDRNWCPGWGIWCALWWALSSGREARNMLTIIGIDFTIS